jgi:NTP pyrophosphatase (non-canonical NTP hydrolase)
MNKEYDDVFMKALNTWGGEAQENMAIEECSELIKAICKIRRASGSQEFKNLIDEIADVTIMMRQMAIAVGEDQVEERIAFKVDRLRERLGFTQELRK